MRRLGIGSLSAVAALVLLAACGQGAASPLPSPSALPSPSPSPSPSPPPSPSPSLSPSPSPSPVVAFVWESRPATAEDALTWHEGCPVGLESLIVVELSHWSFEGEVEYGELVINAAIEDETRQAFARLFEIGFPIRSIRNIDEFEGSDNASMAADNTSGYNCRYAVGGRPTQWSNHAYGRAIDVNPVENPYVDDGEAFPSEGTAYIDRTERPGMLVEGGEALQAFQDAGFFWGGYWNFASDYQHLEIEG